MDGWADGRMGGREERIDAERAQGVREPRMNIAIRLPQRPESLHGCYDSVRDFLVVPHGVATGGPTYDRNALKRIRLISTDGECRRIPTVQPEIRPTAARDIREERFVRRHVVLTGSSD